MWDSGLKMNCSINNFMKNYTSEINSAEFMSERTAEVKSAAGFGTISGLILVLILFRFEYDKMKASWSIQLSEKLWNNKLLQQTIALIILVMVTPLVAILLTCALVYKVLCFILIKRKDRHFVKFLDSFDVFWSLEDDTSKSIINVLGTIEADSPQDVIDDIKKKLHTVCFNEATRKIFYRRSEKYGFYYWSRFSYIDLDQYVELIEVSDREEFNVEDLENMMTELSYQALPYNDQGLFKILVTKQRLGSTNTLRGEYGIIFRIHHSIGDGVALIDFLCTTLADKVGESITAFPFPEAYNCKKSTNGSISELLIMIGKLCEMPLCFVDGILRKCDENSLHGPKLTGKKLFKWTKSDESLFLMVKQIKDNVDQLTFSDVLAAALSKGLQYYFAQTMTELPEEVAVVLPIRFPKITTSDELHLANEFSVTILDLPTRKDTQLTDVKRRCDVVRNSADPLTNHFFLKLVDSVLPKQVLQLLLNSSQATMILSNMPGPSQLNICGRMLKSLVFFVPHKGTTGIGVTALCYSGVLRLAIMADAALICDPQHLTLILDGMVNEIRRLHAKISM